MERLALDELPAHSPWPPRLLGLEEWESTERDLETVMAEYDGEKFASLKQVKEMHPSLGPDELRQFQINFGREGPIAISREEQLYLAGVEETESYLTEQVDRAVDDILDGGETVVELGCSYGYDLCRIAERYPDCTFVGGDISTNALDIASEFVADRPNVSVREFNFYDDEWEILEDRSGEVVVFTKLAVEQLPSASSVVETLASYRETVSRGLHFEPIYELHPDTLLGQLRRAYTDARDYNRDFLSSLRESAHLEVETTTYDRIGQNPLNPISEVRWTTA